MTAPDPKGKTKDIKLHKVSNSSDKFCDIYLSSPPFKPNSKTLLTKPYIYQKFGIVNNKPFYYDDQDYEKTPNPELRLYRDIRVFEAVPQELIIESEDPQSINFFLENPYISARYNYENIKGLKFFKKVKEYSSSPVKILKTEAKFIVDILGPSAVQSLALDHSALLTNICEEHSRLKLVISNLQIQIFFSN